MYPHQLRTITATAATAFAFAVLTAPAPAEPAESFRTDPYYHQTQELRSPDTRDTAAQATAGQDLRSPDTRDAALISEGLMEQPTTTTVRIEPGARPGRRRVTVRRVRLAGRRDRRRRRARSGADRDRHDARRPPALAPRSAGGRLAERAKLSCLQRF